MQTAVKRISNIKVHNRADNYHFAESTTSHILINVDTWGKQMVNPEEQFAEVSAPETLFDPTEIDFCSASLWKMTLYLKSYQSCFLFEILQVIPGFIQGRVAWVGQV